MSAVPVTDTFVLERLPAAAQQYRTPGQALTRQRIYILPSRQGFIFSFLLVTMLLGAVNYNNSMAYLLTFLLASLLLVCMLHTYRNLAGLVINTESARAVFAGEIAYFPLLFDNRLAGEKPAITVTTRAGGFLARRQDTAPASGLFHVPANQQTRFLLPRKTRQRGVVTAGRIAVTSYYPLGLFRAWSYLQNRRKCLVYPAPAGHLPLPDAVPSNPQGGSGGKTGADDFIGFRHYRPGDSVRNIAWKALSREQPVLVKRFSGEKGTQLMLSWQHVSHYKHTEDKLSQLCLWVLQAETAGLDYGLAIPGTTLQPARGEQHRHACLEALARFGVTDD